MGGPQAKSSAPWICASELVSKLSKMMKLFKQAQVSTAKNTRSYVFVWNHTYYAPGILVFQEFLRFLLLFYIRKKHFGKKITAVLTSTVIIKQFEIGILIFTTAFHYSVLICHPSKAFCPRPTPPIKMFSASVLTPQISLYRCTIQLFSSQSATGAFGFRDWLRDNNQ